MDNSQPLAPAQSPEPTPVPQAPVEVAAPIENLQSPQPVEQIQQTQQQIPPAQPVPAKEVPPVQAELPAAKVQGPEFFGYRPPKWANDFEHVRNNKGKGDPSDSDTWLLYLVDRLLKKHSV